MSTPPPRECPDCGEPLAYTFTDTAGVGAWKLGDGFNTTPDTTHYVCFPCAKAWKQRLTGPLTPDVVGDIAFFACRHEKCGSRLAVTHEAPIPTDIELACARGHHFRVTATEDGGLTLSPIGS
jgi:hypothetical protein